MSDALRTARHWLTSGWEGIVIALTVILDNRIRSSLTILGVGVGVMVIVAFGALITGVRTSLSDAIDTSNPESFIVARVDMTSVTLGDVTSDFSRIFQDRPRITPDEIEVIESVPGVAGALFSFDFSASIASESESFGDVPATAQSTDWVLTTPGDFVAGRNFTPAELSARSRVVVLSRPLADDLFGQRDPIGRTVRVNAGSRGVRVQMRVIGVYEPDPNLFSSGFPRWLTVPHTTAQRHLGVRGGSRNQIFVVPDEGVDGAELRESVSVALRLARGLGPRDENNFTILDNDQILASVDELFAVLFLAVVALSSAGLLVGGIGVIGIMLISVTERTREIGIRKAIGARKSEILWQFLVEAGLLTGLGGAAGLLMGGALAEIVAALTPVPATIPFWSIVVALLGATLTGVLFGLLPALRAARLEPVEALRAE